MPRRLWNRFNIFLCGLYRAALRRSRAVLAITLFGLVVFSGALLRLKAVYSFEDMADPRLQQSRLMSRYRAEFDDGESALVLFSPRKPGRFSDEDLLELRAFMNREALSLPGLKKMSSPFDLRVPVSQGNELWYPLLLPTPSGAELAALAKSPWAGVMTDRKGRDFAVTFTWAKRDVENVRVLLTDLDKRFGKDDRIAYRSAGEAVFQHYSKEGVERSVLLSGAMLLFIMLLCRACLGTWRSGLLYAMVVSFASIVTFGLMASFDVTVDLLTSGLMIMLAVAGLEDFLFVSSHRLDHFENPAWRASFRSILLPGFYTSLTTAIGFLSLCASDLSILRNFGLWAGIGALVEWGIIFLVLPALMASFPWWRRWVRPAKLIFSTSTDPVTLHRLPWTAASLLLLVIPLGLYSSFHLKLTGAPKLMMDATHPYIEGLAYLQKTRGWEDRVHLVFPSGWDDPRAARALATIEEHPNVRQTLGLARIEDWMLQKTPASLHALIRREVEQSGAADSYRSRSGQGSVDLFLRDSLLQPVTGMLADIRRACGTEDVCYPAGEIASYADFSNQIPGAFVSSFGTSLLVIGFILILLVRGSGYPWRSCLPVLLASSWAPLLTISCLWIFDIRTNFLTCLFASTLVGMAGDNAIQFVFAGRHRKIEEGIRRRGGGSLMISGVIASSALIYLGSYFVSSRVLGGLMATGIVAAALGDVWLMQFLLELFGSGSELQDDVRRVHSAVVGNDAPGGDAVAGADLGAVPVGDAQ